MTKELYEGLPWVYLIIEKLHIKNMKVLSQESLADIVAYKGDARTVRTVSKGLMDHGKAAYKK